jgi:hypothetical protein
MKIFPAMILLSFFAGCDQQEKQIPALQKKIDSLQKQLNGSYKPGLGEFMSGIQTHHAKLWFAGINNNWKLADFEIQEIQEAVDDIRQFNSDRPESNAISMIAPSLDSVSNAIEQKNPLLFRNSFILLTNTCNNCHRATDHAFNVVTIPAGLPVVNQDFKPSQ